MNCKKFILILISLVIFSFLLGSSIPTIKAVTTEEIQSLIQKLQAQIIQLQMQLAQLQEQPAIWCHTFNTNLYYGSKGEEVVALHLALDKEGITYGDDANDTYGEGTSSAIVEFQEKHSDILALLKLKHGTGNFGFTTKKRMNALYGCATESATTPAQAPISVPATQIPTPSTPIPATLKPGTSPSAVGTSIHRFKPIDPSRCTGTIETSCTLEPANIVKVSVYNEKGGFIDTRENNNSGMAGFLNLPYGNYTVVIDAEGFEYYKASFTVCATCEETTTILLKKKTSTSSIIPSITVLDPNGGNKYLKGSTYTTTWSTVGVNTVYIKLRKGNDIYPGPEGMISDVILNRGSYQWTVPTTLPDGDDYWFVVLDGTYGGPMDYSDAPFSIVTSPTTQIVSGTGFHRFELLDSSACPGCVVGTTCTPCPPKSQYTIYNAKIIVYDEKGRYIDTKDTRNGMATFENLSYGNYVATFSASGFEYDKLTFTVGTNFGTDSTVNMRKTSTTTPTTPTTSPITVVFPNGGESLQIGDVYGVQWKNPGSIKGIFLELYKSGAFLSGLGGLSQTFGAPTSFRWDTIGTANLVIGSDFKIRVRSDTDPTIYDESDNYFSISNPFPSPASCSDLLANSSTNYYFELCKKGGYDRICFNKYYSTYQGCGKSSQYDGCTVSNANAAQNILCDTTVSNPSITVLGPKGGETYKKGEDILIQWKNSGMAAADTELSQTVQLVKADANKTFVLNLGYTTGYEDTKNIKWTVNAEPGQYYIRVYNTGPSGYAGTSGYSYLPITIVSNATSFINAENQLADISKAFLRILEEVKNLLKR